MELKDLIIARAMEKTAGLVTPEMIKRSITTVGGKSKLSLDTLKKLISSRADKSGALLDKRRDAVANRLAGAVEKPLKDSGYKNFYKNYTHSLDRRFANPHSRHNDANNLAKTMDYLGIGDDVPTHLRGRIKRLDDAIIANNNRGIASWNLYKFLERSGDLDVSDPDALAKILNTAAKNYKA